MSSGFSQHPPQPTVHSVEPAVCSFTKDDNTATGAVGLLTYDFFHKASRVCSKRLAVMFSVPYDRNLYKNRLAVGVFDQSQACDKHLYQQMYDGKDQSCFKRCDGGGSCLEYKEQSLCVKATMSSIGKAIVKVEVFDHL